MNMFYIACLGALIGSFLNVCIYRIPKAKSVIFPRSHCQCGQLIPFYHNIPVVSWMLLRGKAACCQSRIPIRYLIVELMTATLFLLTYWRATSLNNFIISCILFSLLIVIAFIDIDTLEIYDGLSIGGMCLGLLLSSICQDWLLSPCGATAMINSIFGACFGSGLLLWISIIGELVLKKEAVGFGDVKLMGLIGSFLGWQGCVFAIFGGCLFSSTIILPTILVLKVRKKAIPKEIPFAPCLVIGSILYVLAGQEILQAIF